MGEVLRNNTHSFAAGATGTTAHYAVPATGIQYAAIAGNGIATVWVMDDLGQTSPLIQLDTSTATVGKLLPDFPLPVGSVYWIDAINSSATDPLVISIYYRAAA